MSPTKVGDIICTLIRDFRGHLALGSSCRGRLSGIVLASIYLMEFAAQMSNFSVESVLMRIIWFYVLMMFTISLSLESSVNELKTIDRL